MSVKLKLAAALFCGATLSACGNMPGQDVSLVSMAKDVLSGKKAAQQAAAPQTPEMVAAAVSQALKETDQPLALMAIESRGGAVALIQQIERNGAYVTWGSADRRSVTTRNGMITATRGLGQDLMSSSVSPSLALVSSRQSGSAQRVHRYLDGENQTIELVTTCTISRAGTGRVVSGEINRPVTKMTESCVAQTTRFQNSYQVDSAGRILQSMQWIGPLNGSAVIQMLR